MSKQGFLCNLESGDKVLLCSEDGEIFDRAEVHSSKGNVLKIWRGASLNPFVVVSFSRKTGKMHKRNLYLQPWNQEQWEGYCERAHQENVAFCLTEERRLQETKEEQDNEQAAD